MIEFSFFSLLTKYKENAGQHPDLYSSEAFSLGRVGGDIIEDVDEDKEQSDEERHPTRHNVRRDEERYPRHNHKQSRR